VTFNIIAKLTLDVRSPTAPSPARVGDRQSPNKFDIELAVKDSNGDFVSGLEKKEKL